MGIGFALAMEDTVAGTPYFYVARYGLNSKITHQNIPDLHFGRWQIGEHWNGGILKIDTLVNPKLEE